MFASKVPGISIADRQGHRDSGPLHVTQRADEIFQARSPLALATTITSLFVFLAVSTKVFSLSRPLRRGVAFAIQGSPLSDDTGSPVSFAAIGSYAMGSVGTVLVYVRCVRVGGGGGGYHFVGFCLRHLTHS